MTADPDVTLFLKLETDMASSRNTDSFLAIWSGISEIFVSCGRRASSPFALRQTAKRFCVRTEKHEHLVVFEPFVVLNFV